MMQSKTHLIVLERSHRQRRPDLLVLGSLMCATAAVLAAIVGWLICG